MEKVVAELVGIKAFVFLTFVCVAWMTIFTTVAVLKIYSKLKAKGF